MTRRRGGTGQSLVEFAFILPIFLLMLLILFDFGRVIFAQNAITQDAQGATRFASVSAPQTDAAIRQRAKAISPGPALPDSAIKGDGGGSFYPNGASAGNKVVVEIEIHIPVITPLLSTIVGGDFTLSSRSEELIK